MDQINSEFSILHVIVIKSKDTLLLFIFVKS